MERELKDDNMDSQTDRMGEIYKVIALVRIS